MKLNLIFTKNPLLYKKFLDFSRVFIATIVL